MEPWAAAKKALMLLLFYQMFIRWFDQKIDHLTAMKIERIEMTEGGYEDMRLQIMGGGNVHELISLFTKTSMKTKHCVYHHLSKFLSVYNSRRLYTCC